MTTLDMIGVIDAMTKRLLRRVDMSDLDYSDIVDNELQLKVLDRYNIELEGMTEAESLAWLVKKLVQVEARLNALTIAICPPKLETEELAKSEDLNDKMLSVVSAGKASVNIDMDNNIVQDGFYGAERTSSGGWLRWLGPRPVASVYLPRIRTPLEVALHLVSVYKGVQLKDVRIALNGGDWAPVAVVNQQGSLILRCRPESGLSGAGTTHRVDIDCGATFSPMEAGEPDLRKLGIAISRIDLASV